jgi:serine acetyltransferase
VLKGLLYGWLADMDVGENADEAVLAYVVSDIQEDGTIVGYEGVVANTTTNAEKEITSILLDSCEICNCQ